jgi:hypothetical protein
MRHCGVFDAICRGTLDMFGNVAQRRSTPPDAIAPLLNRL